MNGNSLTSEPETLMRSLIEEWVKVPFDTSPIDKQKAEAAINLTYESHEENHPQEIVWFDNPLDAVVWMLNNLDFLYRNYFFRNGSKIYLDTVISNPINWEDEITDPIHRSISSNIRDKFENSFNKIIHHKYLHWTSKSFLADFLNFPLRNCLMDLWREEKYMTKRGNYHEIESSEVIAMHDIYYLAAANFYHAIGYDRSEFRGYWQAAKHCGLWWAFYDVAVVTPKPSVICLDDEYKLHAEDKPALVYKGFELYAHHGRYIDSKIVT